ncbi:MAG TPA: TIM barrel protein [Pirellulales bacterium]|nr:TIM barrel protein [Pirellulales bacterium]
MKQVALSNSTRRLALACSLLAATVSPATAGEPNPAAATTKLFARENLVAWCIVPFDAKKRGPEERAEMLQRLGFQRFAYDWRAEHIPNFDAELDALKRHGIQLEAFWFPAALNEDARAILDLLKRHKLHTQLWVTMGDPAPEAKDQAAKVTAAARTLRPIAEQAAKIGCSVALYNHGGWFGEPENQLAVIEELKLANVGIVYNLHHGHEHLERFPDLLKRMLPKLVALNLNGMVKGGEQVGMKIVPLGQGQLDLELLKTIRDSGYRGSIGILGHTQDDAEERLRDNLDGLDWLVPQLLGKPAGPKPKPRTGSGTPAATAAPPAVRGWLAEGKAEYRTPPLTVECRAKLRWKQNYNILVASDTKQSPAHWEIFSMAGSGALTAYLPGMEPDHVPSHVDICDGEWHNLAMQFEPDRVRLYCDGKLAADQAVRGSGKEAVPGPLAFGRLVEGGLGCEGTLEFVRLSRGIRKINERSSEMVEADDATIGLWRFQPDRQTIEDLSKFHNPAKVAAVASPSPGFVPPEGIHLTPVDSRLKVVLIDRSQNDAYMAVKADSLGRLFVGGREAVFVFEPDDHGGYRPRQELYRFPPDSIIIGIELRGNDLYVLTSGALYLFPEGRTRREGLQPKRLLWGLPLDLHVSFHCLAWGPEGDLYLNHGDPLLNYGDWERPDHWGHWTLFTQPEGTKAPYTGTGAVLRLKPDGSGLRVVAVGLRGPVGLAFDNEWNLFTNDNDHESRADQYAPARLLHVTPHADFAWPRGWMPSKSPDRADLLETMNADLGRGVPCDLVYYDEPFLPADLRSALLMCRWDRMAVSRYPPRARGASFEAKELPFLTGENNVRPVGITVGRGGRLFVTSLYLAANVVSPYCVSDLVMITRADDPPDHPFQPYEVVDLPPEKLWAELSSDSWERRQRAHVEILRRGLEPIPKLVESDGELSWDGLPRPSAAEDGLGRPSHGEFSDRLLAEIGENDPALMHLPWIAGQEGSRRAGRWLRKLSKHPRSKVRSQAVRALAEFPRLKPPREGFVQALGDDRTAVRLAALAHFFTADGSLPFAEVVVMAGSRDSYLRQTACLLLARRATVDEINHLSHSDDEAERLAGVLAAGMKLTIPACDDVPPAELPLFFPEGNAFFHPSLAFAGEVHEIKLAELGRIGSYTIAERWKRVEHTSERQELFDLLVRSLGDHESPIRLQAAYYLSLMRDPRAEPLVALARWDVRVRELSALPPRAITQVWAIGPFDDGDKGLLQRHPPEQGPIDLSAKYASPLGPLHWERVEANDGRFDWRERLGRLASSSYDVAFRLQNLRRQGALMTIEAGDAVQVWQNGRPIEPGPRPRPGQTSVLLDVQPGGNDVLVRVHGATGHGTLQLRLNSGDGLVADLPEKLDASLLAERLKEASAAGGPIALAPEFLTTDWRRDVERGDAAQGRKLFGTLGCVKCHAITAEQKGNGAPSLTDARKRFTVPYLVESVLLPSKQVVELFRATSIETADGQSMIGLIVRETADEIELLLPDATRKTVAASEIESRQLQALSPMPAGIVKTPAELRDLLAYLLSENPQAP